MKNRVVLKDRYTKEEAKKIIDTMLSKYGKECEIVFYNAFADIIDSYKVVSVKEQRTICEIIARTGLTKRTSRSLAAEWQVHNLAWYLRAFRSHAKDVALDYEGDPRKYVRFATSVFELLNAKTVLYV